MKKNLTARSKKAYELIQIPGDVISIEFNKDRNHRSVFEILVNTYHKGNLDLSLFEFLLYFWFLF